MLDESAGIDMSTVEDMRATNIRVAWFFFVFALSSCWLYSIAGRFLLDPDTFWHIAIGQEILDTWRLPVSDEKSHTFRGQPWIAKEWLSQIVLYLAYRAGGWPLLISLSVFSISLAASFVFYFVSARVNAALALLVALAALVLSTQTYLARPHVLTFPLCVLWTEYLLRASEQRRAPSLWLLILVVAWANLHNSYTIAFLVAGLCATNFLERSRLSDRAALLRWAMFLLLCLPASMIHPYGYEPLLVSLNAPGNEWVTLKGDLYAVGEWRAVDVASEPVHAVALVALLFLLLAAGTRLTASKAAFVVVILYSFLSHIRFAYLFYYLTPIVVSFELPAQHPALSASQWSGKLDDGISAFLSRHVRAIATCAILAYVAVAASFTIRSGLVPRDAIAPAAAFEAAKTAGLTGNVLNSDEFGGFLVFRGIKTFLDGRNDQLFRGQFLRDVLESQQAGGTATLARQLREFNIGWTLLRPSDPRVPKLDSDPRWRRLYADSAAVIHVPVRNP